MVFTSFYQLSHKTRRVFISFAAAAAKSLQLRLSLCDPVDGRPPGSPVPGILQARILEWVAIIVAFKQVLIVRENAQDPK